MSVTRDELIAAFREFNLLLREGVDLADAQLKYLNGYVRNDVTMDELMAASKDPSKIDVIVAKLNKPTTPQTGGKRRTNKKRPKKRPTRRRRRR